MIDDVLKQHKPGDKPRFFLHDEMKAWLADNLEVSFVHSANRSIDYDLQRKLGLNNTLLVGHNIGLSIYLDGEPISVKYVQIPMEDYERALKTMANVCEKCITEITQQQNRITSLEYRIDQLEKPKA